MLLNNYFISILKQ